MIPAAERRVREAAGQIYGTILVTALVAGLSEDETVDAWQILVSVTATTLVFWVAHAYAEVLSRRLVGGTRLSWRIVWTALAQEWSMVQAGLPAAVALGLASLGAVSTETGVELAIGAGVVALFAYGVLLARLERASAVQVLGSGLLNAAFGVVIVLLKAFVH